MVIPPVIGNPYKGNVNPDPIGLMSLSLLYGSNGSFDPIAHINFSKSHAFDPSLAPDFLHMLDPAQTLTAKVNSDG